MTYHAKITSKGQITIPVELRTYLGLAEGDVVEFYLDHVGRVCVRPRRSGTRRFLDSLPPPRTVRHVTDDDAIADAILSRDDRTRPKKRQRVG